MSENKTWALARKKKKLHVVPKMSTEAQIVLQEIRSFNTPPEQRSATNLQYLLVSPITSSGTTDKLPDVNSRSSRTAINHDATQQLTKMARLSDIEYPAFVITLPGFDIRYNMTALRPVRESPQERERNKHIQKKSIAKCKEWLGRF